MVVKQNVELTKRKATGELVLVVDGKRVAIDNSLLQQYEDFYNTIKVMYECDREKAYDDFMQSLGNESVAPASAPTLSPEETLEKGIDLLMNFFTEFQFEPNFRFVNTLVGKANKSSKVAKDYIARYFSLMDNQYSNEIKQKVNSKEFANILKMLSAVAPKSSVNNRFKIYYGSAGCGKTTKAQTETDNRCIVCNASMLPSDLMEDFVFAGGQPSFKPSILWECMEKGLPLVLDEINLLPFDSLRFLQGILDGKAEFSYKGNTVHINNGFKVIGTMNLSIGGMTYGLPEPLVDRCEDIEEFKLTAQMLAKSVL